MACSFRINHPPKSTNARNCSAKVSLCNLSERTVSRLYFSQTMIFYTSGEAVVNQFKKQCHENLVSFHKQSVFCINRSRKIFVGFCEKLLNRQSNCSIVNEWKTSFKFRPKSSFPVKATCLSLWKNLMFWIQITSILSVLILSFF